MQSLARHIGSIQLPAFTGLQVYMQETTGARLDQDAPEQYRGPIRDMLNAANIPDDLPFFITIDERTLYPNESHRRGGAHVDGNYIYGWGGNGWLNGVAGRILSPEKHAEQYHSPMGGTLFATNYQASVAWLGEIDGLAGQGGSCDHLRDQFEHLPTLDLGPDRIVLMNSTCVHQGFTVSEQVDRQLLRLTLHHSYVYPQ